MVSGKKTNMKALVTGATGFIGSHLVERLIHDGFEVRALVRKRDNETRKDTFELLKKLNVEIFEGDLLDKGSLKKIGKEIDVVFHLAAIARPMAIPNELYFKINEKGTDNLFEVCLDEGVKKIVMMSSVSAVGPSKDGNAVNEETDCNPVDIYGWSKLAQEKIAFEYINRGLQVILLRPPMVFGPRDFEMLRLFKAANRGFFPVKSKNKCFEFLYVENLVEACLLALENGKIGETYHITNGEPYSINDIMNSIGNSLRKDITQLNFPSFIFNIIGNFVESIGKIFSFHPPFKHDTVNWMTQKLWYSNPNKSKRELNYNPKFTLNEGVKKTVNYYQKIKCL
jgi:nucleoside-diphosphate-sugar epimerase